ncbi:MAG: hypothetical protein LBE08_11945 [Bifidobacteriaceae bacterium]|jgi:hypothetical protein|nr:hypothetical protein [Bifidobacteriaceae bacterium]
MGDARLAVRDLAAFLTGSEAGELADHLAGDETLTQALKVIGQARRNRVRQLLQEARLGSASQSQTVAALRAIDGSTSTPTRQTNSLSRGSPPQPR